MNDSFLSKRTALLQPMAAQALYLDIQIVQINRSLEPRMNADKR